MRSPRFSAGPWRMLVDLGARFYTISSRRGFVASVERVEDARLVQRAPELYSVVATLAEDIRLLLIRNPQLAPADRAWLVSGIARAVMVLNEIDGVKT